MRRADQRGLVGIADAWRSLVRQTRRAFFENVGRTHRTGLRDQPAISYKRSMAETTYFPRRLILAGAMVTGVLLALAVHMLGVRFGLDLGGLWRSDSPDFMP